MYPGFTNAGKRKKKTKNGTSWFIFSVIINGGPTAKLMMFKWDCYQILTKLMVFKLEKLTSSCVFGLRLLSLKNKLCRVEILGYL